MRDFDVVLQEKKYIKKILNCINLFFFFINHIWLWLLQWKILLNSFKSQERKRHYLGIITNYDFAISIWKDYSNSFSFFFHLDINRLSSQLDTMTTCLAEVEEEILHMKTMMKTLIEISPDQQVCKDCKQEIPKEN